MKRRSIRAGKCAVLIRRRFRSVPTDHRFRAEPAPGTGRLTGRVDFRGSSRNWPGPLTPDNPMTAGFGDTFLTVHVVPDRNAVIPVSGAGVHTWPRLAALIVIAPAIAVAILAITR